MTQKIASISVLIMLTTLFSCSSVKKSNVMNPSNKDVEKELTHFPKEKKGFQRHVIYLPSKSSLQDEYQFKVELMPGKKMLADCNIQSLNGSLTEKTVSGFGYTYYEFVTNGTVISTMMACPDKKKTEKYIAAPTELVRYNSSLPIVVFVPNGYDLQYRIWEAGTLRTSTVK